MSKKQPNILIFMTDHQRGDMAPPFQKAITPNLDKFYKDAVAFTHAYCPAPHCCPSRATFFSGLYPSEHGVWNNVEVGNTLSKGLHDGVKLWSEDLKENGYNLYYSGKWHVSSEEGPEDRGWEITYHKRKYKKQEGHRELPDSNDWKRYLKDNICKDGEQRGEAQIIRPGYPSFKLYGVDEDPYNDKAVVESSAEAILNREPSDKPWCQFVGPLGPHDPYCLPQRFIDMYKLDDIKLPESFHDPMTDKPNLYRRTRDNYSQLSELEHRKSILHFLAFCSYEDYLFGEVLKALESKGELDDTVIIYTSDHGDYVGEHGLWAKGLPCFRQAYHIPVLIKWPGEVVDPGRAVEEFVSLADLAPTILDMAGVKADRNFTGRSLVPFLHNEKPAQWRDAVYTQSNGNELYGIQRSVMTKDWKYVYNGFDYDELYDLKEDPNEMHNLINDPKYKDVVRKMCKKLWQFAYDHKDVCVNSYIMVALAPYGPGIIFDKNEN